MTIDKMLVTEDGWEAVMVFKFSVNGQKFTIPLVNCGNYLEVCEFDGMDEVLDEFGPIVDDALAVANTSDELYLMVTDWSDPFINIAYLRPITKHDVESAYLSIIDYEKPDYE